MDLQTSAPPAPVRVRQAAGQPTKKRNKGAMRSSHPILNPRTGSALLAIVFAASLAGCGGVKFVRAPGSTKHRALPFGAKVTTADKADGLAQPTELIGTLHAVTKGEKADREGATVKLTKHASRYGCDAIVAVKSERKETEKKTKLRKLGKDGRPYYEDKVAILVQYDWSAQCIRTAKAPKAPVKKKRAYASRKSTPATRTSPRAKPAPATNPAPAPAPVSPPPTSAAPPPPPANPAAPAAPAGPPPDTGDPKTSQDVARAFMALSGYLAASNAGAICSMLDAEKVVFNVRTRDPVIKFKSELTSAKACESFKNGKLAAYLRDFGPAEVHAEVATLVPTLFGIHRGAYMQLPDSLERSYADQLSARRAGKKPLACYAYFVRQADNLFVVSLSCRGVEKYRVLLRRDPNSVYKVLNYTHLR